ncbi:MAG: hypothetical protein HFI72_02465, partial [Peptococcaceae bacterium]|nr:hypothetical protein [Peptococcaceae bacterium]
MVPPIPQAAWAAPSSTNSGLTIATGGRYTLSNNTVYTVSNGTGYVKNVGITVEAGTAATIVVPNGKGLWIDNRGSKDYPSPIDIKSGGSLTIITEGNGDVDCVGAPASNGETATTKSSHAGGVAGKAAIHVPYGATLTIRGTGIVKAYGGFAGDGGDGTGSTTQAGPGGGGGAGAGIGGNGGAGGTGTGANVNPPAPAGEQAGTINLYGTGIVKAIGGGGGYGGKGSDNGYTGGAGGGYPAAGIGGGGAGGGGANHGIGAGGFSGGAAEDITGGTQRSANGDGTPSGGGTGGGGGYFSNAKRTNEVHASYGITNEGHYGELGGTSHKVGSFNGCFGGLGVHSTAGDGGQGGAGGTLNLTAKAEEKLAVFNGTYKTDATDWDELTATPIYLQLGYKPSALRGVGITDITNKTAAGVKAAADSKGLIPANGSRILGVGSGAGATESHNGSITTQK